MPDNAIHVESLSKRYQIGLLQERRDTLRDALSSTVQRLGQSKRKQAAQENSIWALKDVSFDIQLGEAVGIIGRNGAGKSTLLKILSQVTEPTSGRAVINGRVGSLLEVGTGFHPELTGRENIYLNGAILGMSHKEIDRKFNEIVAFTEIEKFIDTPVKRYSSGMYVRLAFGVAAHLEPEILLIDEVLAVGDAQFQKKCLGKMGDATGEGRTILFVSHNLIALRSLCARVIWLDSGKLREEGPSSDVITNYLQPQSIKKYEQVWNDPTSAPGNDSVRIHRIWVESKNGMAEGDLAREIPISIGVEYWNQDPTAQLHVTLHVSVELQVVAFTTGSSQTPGWQELAQRLGLIQYICNIPANFLNTGQYRIKVLIVKDRSKVIFTLEDALVFEVIETKQREGAYFGNEPGVVRPILPWEIQYLGDGLSPSSKQDNI
jgi:lipopolysaccharide transport system ATP-binding protein